MVSCQTVTAEALEAHFDKHMFQMLDYFGGAGAAVSLVSYKEIYHTSDSITCAYEQEQSFPTLRTQSGAADPKTTTSENCFFKFSQSFGYSVLDDKEIVDIDKTLFDSGTCARLLCGLALAQLEKEGKINMKDRVSDYLEDHTESSMTLEDVLLKRSKLLASGDKENVGDAFSPCDDESSDNDKQASFYAEQIVEKASGTDFRTYMEEDLLPKLGLSLPRIDEESGEECFTYVKNKNKKMLQLKTLQSKLTPESGLISTTAQMNQVLTAILEHVQANEENISDTDSGYHLLPGFGFGFKSVRFFPGSLEFFVCVSAMQDNGNAIICVEPKSKWAIWIACNTCCEDKGSYQDLFKGEPLCYFILKEFISNFGLSEDMSRRSLMKWTIDPGPGRNDHVTTLFCFPYVGGNSRSVFRNWYTLLPEFIEVKAISLPGRGPRINEKPHRRLLILAEQIAIGILPILKDKKFAFYGDGIGALLAFEVGRYLYTNHGLSPMWCFFSGCPSPTTYTAKLNSQLSCLGNNKAEGNGKSSRLNAEMIERLCSCGKLPMVLKENPLLARAMLPSIQADLEMESTYKYKRCPYRTTNSDTYFCESEMTTLSILSPNTSPRREAGSVLQLQCPITVFREPKVSEKEEKDLDQWKLVTEMDVLFVQVPGCLRIDKEDKTTMDICRLISESIGTSLTKFESWIGWAARCI